MKKQYGNLAIAIVIAFCLIVITISISGCHAATKDLGGEMTVNLESGQKLEEVTRKETDLWILTRPFREGEEPEIHTFQEKSEFGVLEGKVTIIESEGK